MRQRALAERHYTIEAGDPNTGDVVTLTKGVPGWVHGRFDELPISLHEQLADFEIPRVAHGSRGAHATAARPGR